VRRIHRQDDGHMWAVVTQRAGCGGASPWGDLHINHTPSARRGRLRVLRTAVRRWRPGLVVGRGVG
jgi:hypothetical protein